MVMNRTPSSPDPAAGSLTAAAVAVVATLIVQIGIDKEGVESLLRERNRII